MKLLRTLATLAAFSATTLALTAPVLHAQDPGPAAYSAALTGKRVIMVPMAMGFDLAQGWPAYVGREVTAFGGVRETRDPNWSVEAGAQTLTEAIASEPKPDMLLVMSPDPNSYAKILRRAQEAGIYVVLIDNPANFAADAYISADWDVLGQREAEAVIAGRGEGSSKKIGLVQGDQVNATSLYQYAGIMKVLEQHPDFTVGAKPDSNWDATTARKLTTTMLQQTPDICGIIDFWDGNATGTAAAIRDAGLLDQVVLVTTGGGDKAACDAIENGTCGAVVMTDVRGESGAIVPTIKHLLQSGQPAGTASPYLYTLLKATTKADLQPDTCWDLKALTAAN